MISVTVEMIFRAVIFSSVFGFITGALYTIIRSAIDCFGEVICKKMPGCIFFGKTDNEHHLLDFFFVVVLCLIHILSMYVLLDGFFNI